MRTFGEMLATGADKLNVPLNRKTDTIAIPHQSAISRPAGQPTGSSRPAKRLDVQGLRAVAVLLVVAVHADLPVPAGFAGVDIFFVISGFVITTQIHRKLQVGHFSFVGFYASRIRRLLPAMVVMLLTVLTLSFLLQSPLGAQQNTGLTAAGTSLLLGNLAILHTSGSYFAAAASTNPLLHVWSLAVEEQFYLAFPLILVVAAVAGRRRTLGRRIALALGTLTVATFAVAMAFTYMLDSVGGSNAAQLSFYSSPTRAWEFGAGALVALWAQSRAVNLTSRRIFGWSAMLGLVSAVVLVAMNFLIDGDTPWPGLFTLLPVTGTVLLIASGTVGNGFVTRGLAASSMVKIGDLSYSIYLWHWPAILFAGLLWPQGWVRVLAAVISFGPAWLSYQYVEQRFRTKANPSGSQVKVYAAALGAVTAVVVAGLAVQHLGPLAVPKATQYLAERSDPLTFGRQSGCMVDARSFKAADLNRCTVPAPSARGWVMLVGDSHADAISNGVIAAAARLGYSTMAVTGAGCEFSRTADASNTVPNCAEMNSALLDRATGPNPPAAVVMSHWFAARTDKHPEWPAVLRPAMQELSEAGLPIVFALDVPSFAGLPLTQSSSCRGGWINFSCERPESVIAKYQGPSREAELALAGSVRGVELYDPWSAFCRQGTCSSLVDGRLGYWDYNHLNGTGSVALTAGLEIAIQRATGN